MTGLWVGNRSHEVWIHIIRFSCFGTGIIRVRDSSSSVLVLEDKVNEAGPGTLDV